MLNTEQIQTFQRLYLQRFGVELTAEQAYEQGEKLVALVEIVLFGATQANDKSDREENNYGNIKRLKAERT